MYDQHNVTMDLLLKNREKQLAKLAALQKKLDAAEKVEICRKIRVKLLLFSLPTL